MLRNSASGREIGLPARILAGLLPGKHENRLSGRPKAGRWADFGAFPVAARPKSGPEGRFPARKHYCVTWSASKTSGISVSSQGCDMCWVLNADRARGRDFPPPGGGVRTRNKNEKTRVGGGMSHLQERGIGRTRSLGGPRRSRGGPRSALGGLPGAPGPPGPGSKNLKINILLQGPFKRPRAGAAPGGEKSRLGPTDGPKSTGAPTRPATGR